jgi:hypothetical protein
MKLLFLTITIIFCSAVFSQDFSLYLHAKGALNGSTILNNTIATNETQNYGFAFSGNGGVGASFLYEDKVGASIEMLFGNHSAKYTGKYTIGLTEENYSSTINLSLLQIPLLFRLDQEEGYLELGPQLNLVTGANYSSNFVGFTDDNITEAYKRASFSGVLGFGSYHALGGKRSPVSLSFGLRINYGLSDVEGANPEGIWYVDLPNKKKSLLLAGGLNLGIHYKLK